MNLTLLVSLCLLAPAPLDLYVATDGNDAWSGRLPQPNAERTDGPLATLAGAQASWKKAPTAGAGVTVHIAGGTYSLPATLKLDAADAGTADAPLVLQAAAGAQVIVTGAARVSDFRPYKGKILQAQLPPAARGGAAGRQLLFEGRRQHLARYPNFDSGNPYAGGFAYVDGTPVPMYLDRPDDDKRRLTYKAAHARSWGRPEEVEVFIFPRYNWWNNIIRVAKVDAAARQLTLKGNASYAIRPGDRYWVQNALEELDAPGEFYIDAQAGVLYFWPPAQIDGKAAYLPVLTSLVEVRGAAHIAFRGLTFEGCLGTAIQLADCRNCQVAGCTIREVGDYHGSGVVVNGGQNNSVFGCDIHHIGSHAIAINGGDRKTLTPAGNAAENNYLHHFGVYHKQGVGVHLHGVGNRAAHNLVHDGPRMGIMFSGNNLAIEYNHIRHVNLETEDTGAVYTGGRDWISSRGTVLRYNYFHDILGFGQHQGRWVSPYFAWGVYLDDNAGGVDVVGNIVVRATRAGIHLHNGRDNHIENNIFVDNGPQQVEYSGWTTAHRYWKNHFDSMLKGYESVAGQPAWTDMRHMELHPKDAPLPDETLMSGNRFQRNIVAFSDPAAKLYGLRNVNFDHNHFDHNIFWHQGKPIATSEILVKSLASENLLQNAGFEEALTGKTPPGWKWQVRPNGAAAESLATAAAEGQRALAVDAAPPVEGKPQTATIVAAASPAAAGDAFKATVRLRAEPAGLKAALLAQSYIAKVYFWSKEQPCTVGGDWREYELVFQLPSAGERGHHQQMKDVSVRIDLRDAGGRLWVDAASLKKAVLADPWEAWRSKGRDRHSIVADPRFVDPAKDDFRLRPDSPAWALGFKPIPVEKIGPYRHPLRATWPIVEAEGAREKPLVTPH